MVPPPLKSSLSKLSIGCVSFQHDSNDFSEDHSEGRATTADAEKSYRRDTNENDNNENDNNANSNRPTDKHLIPYSYGRLPADEDQDALLAATLSDNVLDHSLVLSNGNGREANDLDNNANGLSTITNFSSPSSCPAAHVTASTSPSRIRISSLRRDNTVSIERVAGDGSRRKDYISIQEAKTSHPQELIDFLLSKIQFRTPEQSS